MHILEKITNVDNIFLGIFVSVHVGITECFFPHVYNITAGTGEGVNMKHKEGIPMQIMGDFFKVDLLVFQGACSEPAGCSKVESAGFSFRADILPAKTGSGLISSSELT